MRSDFALTFEDFDAVRRSDRVIITWSELSKEKVEKGFLDLPPDRKQALAIYQPK